MRAELDAPHQQKILQNPLYASRQAQRTGGFARASVDKLKLHRIDQSISTAVIKFEKEESVEFGTWAELESYDFKVPYVTQEVMLRWDFLLQLNST